MKTLNERLYEYLLNAEEPQSLSAVAAAFPEVPRMILGKALLGIAAEGIAYYTVKNGKMYFSTDSTQGRNATPCHDNLNRLSMGTGFLSSLLGGGKPDLGALLGAQSKSFPQQADSYPAVFNNAVCGSKRYEGDGYSIGFPEGFEVKKDYDSSHEYGAWYPGDVDADEASMIMYANFKPVEGNPSRETAFMQCCIMEQLYAKMGLAGERVEYRNDHVDAFYLLSYPNTHIFAARPDGMMMLRVDWNLDDEMPPAALAKQMINNWLDSLTYTGTLQYYVPRKLCRPELLKSELTEQTWEPIGEEFELGINDYNRMINAAKVRFTTEKATKTPTTTIYNARIALQKAADQVDGYMLDMMELIAHYVKVAPESPLIKRLYEAAVTLFNVVSEIAAEIKIDGGSMGAYNSATDLVISGNNNESTYTVQVYPAHYPEFLRCVTLEFIENAKLTGSEKEHAETAYKNNLKTYEAAQKAEVYQTEYKMEGGMLAAYLGDEAHVVLPDYVKAIGDFSFKSCHKLESVELGENVTYIGFSPFEDCPNLKTLTIPDGVENINGPLLGFTFGQKIKTTIRGYADSYAQKYAKENKYPFETIVEDNLDVVVELEEGSGDFLEDLFLPVPKDFISSERLSAAEKKAFAENEDTEHLTYACVPADAPKGFADYKNVRFSVSATEGARDVPNALELAEEVEQRLNGLEHVHDKFRTCTAEKGKIVVKYDLTREGEEDGVKWCTYVVLLFRGDKMGFVQIFMNGNYTHRQQEFAVKKWASQIRFEKAVREEQRKKQAAAAEEERKQKEAAAEKERKEKEAAAMEIYERDMAQWKVLAAEIEKQRSDELQQIMAKTEADWNAELEKEYGETIRRADEALVSCKQQKEEAEAKLASLGMFKFAEKKAAKQTIDLMTSEIARAAARRQGAAENRKREMAELKNRLAAKRKQVMEDLEKRYPMPAEPRKPYFPPPEKSKPVNKPVNSSMTATQIANESIKEALLDTLEDLGLATISDLQEACPAASDLSNQRVSALIRQMVSDGRVKRIEKYGKVYFAVDD